MECKKCKCALGESTYCMRCGTENGSKVTIANEPQEKGTRDVMKSIEKDDMFTKPIVDLTPLSLLTAVGMIFGFIVAMTYIGEMNVVTLSITDFNTAIWNITLRLAIVLIPVSTIIAVIVRRHINYAYESTADEATREVSRTLFKSNMKVWSIFILVTIIMPLILGILSNGMTMQELGFIGRIFWEFIKHFWPIIILYLIYAGITSLLINLTQDKYPIIRLTALISTIIVLAIYFFV